MEINEIIAIPDVELDNKEQRKRLHRVTKACVNCQKSHLSCETTRPCKRCLERGKTCCDAESKRRGRKKKSIGIEEGPEPIQEEDYEIAANELALLDYTFITSSKALPSFNDRGEFKEETQDVSNQLDLPVELFSEFFFTPMNRKDIRSGLGVSESDTTPSRLDFFRRYRELSKLKCGESSFLEKTVVFNRDHLSSLKASITVETIESMKQEFEKNLADFKRIFDGVGVPAMIWDRCCVIHYVNNALKKLTGFNLSLPTNLDSFELIQQLSSEGWKNYGEGLFERSIGGSGSTDSWIFSAGILAAHTKDKYIQGTLCVTIKRDLMGVPLILLGNFLPNLQR